MSGKWGVTCLIWGKIVIVQSFICIQNISPIPRTYVLYSFKNLPLPLMRGYHTWRVAKKNIQYIIELS